MPVNSVIYFYKVFSLKYYLRGNTSFVTTWIEYLKPLKISFAIICLKLDFRMFIMANPGIVWWRGTKNKHRDWSWAVTRLISTNENSCSSTSDQSNDRISRYISVSIWLNCSSRRMQKYQLLKSNIFCVNWKL